MKPTCIFCGKSFKRPSLLEINKGAGGQGRGRSRIPYLFAPPHCKQDLLPLLRTLSRALSALIYVAPTAYGQLKIVKKFKLGPA